MSVFLRYPFVVLSIILRPSVGVDVAKKCLGYLYRIKTSRVDRPRVLSRVFAISTLADLMLLNFNFFHGLLNFSRCLFGMWRHF